MEFNWLDIAKRLEAIAQTGLANYQFFPSKEIQQNR
jgi:hypothetical protein